MNLPDKSTMVAMVMLCDIIDSCHDINLEHCDVIMASSDHSKLRSTHIICCIKGGFLVGKVNQSRATRHGRHN